MNAFARTSNPITAVTTTCGGENVTGFRVVRIVSRADSTKAKKKVPRTLAEVNKWLLENASKVDRHAKASTKRLIGRESV